MAQILCLCLPDDAAGAVLASLPSNSFRWSAPLDPSGYLTAHLGALKQVMGTAEYHHDPQEPPEARRRRLSGEQAA
ncbi:MAG: hypothetical protein H6842_04670 [Rhodospirillaceae bacterium]|nr:hypothetical protein [Rhodospirillaceae bacterium]